MGASYTTEDGFTLTIQHTMYMDYGLSIRKGDEELFYNPCCLSNESYGHKPNPDKFDDWDEAEAASFDGDDEAFVPWTEEDWIERLKDDANIMIEAYLGPEVWDEAS